MRAFLVGASLACAACGFDGKAAPGDGPGPDRVAVGFVSASSLVDETAGTHELVVQLSRAADQPITVAHSFTSGTATVDADFVATAGTLTFAPGETQQTITVDIVADLEDEGDETFELALASPTNADLATASHLVTISGRVLPRISFERATSSGVEMSSTTVDVVLSTASTRPITVDLTVSGTADTPADHDLTGIILMFAPGETRKTVTIGTVDDALDEDDETVIATLGNPSNALLGTTTQFAHTITDNDAPPVVTFTANAQTVDEGAGTVQVTATLSTESGRNVIVPFAIDGTATSTVDYTVNTPSPLTFPPGTTSRTISIAIIDDMLDEPSETVRLALGTPTNATRGTPTQHVITIADNEPRCYGTGAYRVCITTNLTNTITLPTSINTDTSGLCATTQPTDWTTAQGQPASCFILAGTLDVTNTTTVTGSRPLVLVADGTLSISGTLDVSSHRAGNTRGAGTASAACGAFTPPTLSTDVDGADGGGGGSFMTAGGAGGGGNTAATGGVPPGPSSAPVRLQAGCAGQDGGTGVGAGGLGGGGGGAVYLVAGGTIRITGTVNASGAGGTGGGNFAGGGGGGSGGMIKLSAPAIDVVGGVLLANGGGGAGGSDNNESGLPGADPNPVMPLAAAAGGNGPSGIGGRGFAGALAAGNGESTNKGGAGGGGGGGFIQSDAALSGAQVSAGTIQAP